MPVISVSKDTITKVKTALNDYHIDISGFSIKVEKQASDISKSAMFEMQKVSQKIIGTTNKTNRLKTEINKRVQRASNIKENRIPLLTVDTEVFVFLLTFILTMGKQLRLIYSGYHCKLTLYEVFNKSTATIMQ